MHFHLTLTDLAHTHAWMHIHKLKHTHVEPLRQRDFTLGTFLLIWLTASNKGPWKNIWASDKYVPVAAVLWRRRRLWRERERESVLSYLQRYTKTCQTANGFLCDWVCVCVCVNVCPCQPLDITRPSHGRLLGSVAEWIRLFTSSLFGLGQTSCNSLMGVEGGCYTEASSFIWPCAPWARICMRSDLKHYILTARRPGPGHERAWFLEKICFLITF